MANAIHPNPIQDPDIKANTPDAIALNDDEIDQVKGTGDVLNNRFKLLQCVGSGGMSTVYKAIDRRKLEAKDSHPHVAVKVLNLEFRTHPKSLIALQREAKKCQSLSHPNIVRVYDFDRDDTTVYMTMEYLSGASLGRKMREPDFTGIPQEQALKIIYDVGQALRFAHHCGIVHADFKPANVIITDEGKVKVIDFGIARGFQQDDDAEIDATCFDPGSLQAYTPNYASPQMLKHQKPNPRDDIYALACTAYEMLTGRHPFGRIPATAAHETGLKLQPHKALTRNHYIALKRALEFDHDKRTATVDQFLKEINQKTGINRKSATTLGLIALGVGISVSYNYLIPPGVGLSTGITTQDSQSAVNTTIETRSLGQFATSANNPKLNTQKGAIEHASPTPLSSPTNLELKYDLTFWESINDKKFTEYQAYLEAFPNGHFASEAKLRVTQLTQAAKAQEMQTNALPRLTVMDSKYEFASMPETSTQAVIDPGHRNTALTAYTKLGRAQAAEKSLQLPHLKNVNTKTTSKGEVARLLASAEMHFNADRLMAPKFNNALFMYRKVLKLDADNPYALAGINSIKAKLLGFASDAQAQNDLETARSQLKKVLVIDPQDDEIWAALAALW